MPNPQLNIDAGEAIEKPLTAEDTWFLADGQGYLTALLCFDQDDYEEILRLETWDELTAAMLARVTPVAANVLWYKIIDVVGPEHDLIVKIRLRLDQRAVALGPWGVPEELSNEEVSIQDAPINEHEPTEPDVDSALGSEDSQQAKAPYTHLLVQGVPVPLKVVKFAFFLASGLLAYMVVTLLFTYLCDLWPDNALLQLFYGNDLSELGFEELHDRITTIRPALLLPASILLMIPIYRVFVNGLKDSLHKHRRDRR